MGIFGGVKQRLGFGDRPEWQDDEDVYNEDGVDGGAYPQDETGFEQESDYGLDGAHDEYAHQRSTDVISFDSYNPDTFSNVKMSSDSEPMVATSASARTTHPYSSDLSRRDRYRSATSASSQRGSGRSRMQRGSSSATCGAYASSTWATPKDPAFLDTTPHSAIYGREVLADIGIGKQDRSTSAADPLSQFDSEMRQMSRDVSVHLEVVFPRVYGDVQKIAAAAKADKTVVLVLKDTKSDLAKRILDFSFGVASALNKNVDKAHSGIFVISKGAEMLTEAQRSYLTRRGVL